MAEVAAAQAAVNAAQMPTVADPIYSADFTGGLPEVTPAAPLETRWYRASATTAQVFATEFCDGLGVDRGWVNLVADGAGGLVLQISAQDLVPGARDQVIRRLPTPLPHIGPADERPDGFTFVNMPTYFWLDRGPGQWNPVTATASAGPVSVTVTAQPEQLAVDPGDGGAALQCAEFLAVLVGDVAAHGFPAGGCSYRYLNSSSTAANGETWPVTVSINWHVTWTANTGEGGDLGYVSTAAEPRELPVAESQAIIGNVDG